MKPSWARRAWRFVRSGVGEDREMDHLVPASSAALDRLTKAIQADPFVEGDRALLEVDEV